VSHVSDAGHDHARVYNELKAIVIAYRFRPGEQLLIGELADRLRVSTTPIREALIRLQAEGLLDPVHRRGFFARELSAKEMIDLHECGALLLKQALAQNNDEPATHAFALAIGLPPAMAASEEAEIVPEDRVRQCADYLERLYERIAHFSRNDVLISMVRNIMDRTHYVRLIDLESPTRFNHVLVGIDEIAAALQTGDVDRATAVVERDFKLIVKRMPAIIREGVSRAYVLHGPPAPIAMNGLAGTRSR
jgi:DNA-binding GntR family transcriptional regulator